MSKFTSFLKATPKRIILLSVLVVIIANACKKEVVGIFADKQSNKAAVQWAKDYYKQNLLPKQANFMSIRGKTQMNINGSTDNRIKEVFLNWELAGADTTQVYDFVEIPLKSNFISRSVFEVTTGNATKPPIDEKTLNAGFDRLIIYKNRDNVINQRIVSYVPDKEYVSRHNGDISHNTIKNLDDDFFGYLEYKEWNGKTLFVLRIENGKSVKKLVNRIPVAGISMQKMNAVPNAQKLMVEANPGTQTCQTVTQSHKERWCYYEYWWDTFPISCDPWETIIDGYYQVCTNPNDQGGGGGEEDPVDCSDPANFDVGGCVELSKDIIDNLIDTCLKKSLLKVKNAKSVDTISKIISNLNGNAKVKVTVSQSSNLTNAEGAPVDGKTTSYDYNNGIFSCSIVLNESLLNNSTQEYAVNTIVHEILHAYLQYTAGTVDYHSLNHQNIATKYVIPMVNLLHGIFPSLDLRDATAMAWGGLESTDLWKANFQNDVFTVGGTTTTMTFSDMKGRETAHRNGYAENSNNKCAN